MTARVVGPNRTHGTISCYNAGCHCTDCRCASRAYRYRYRTPKGIRQRRVSLCPFCAHGFLSLGNHERTCPERAA